MTKITITRNSNENDTKTMVGNPDLKTPGIFYVLCQKYAISMCISVLSNVHRCPR